MKSCETCKNKKIYAFTGACSGCNGSATNYSKWEDENKTSQFKAMKFWIGDDPKFSEKVQNILFSLGYVWYGETKGVVEKTNTTALYTSVNGCITYTDYSSKARNFAIDPRVEIDIDWMRTPKKETIELNGKKYLKEDLEEALKHLKPVN